MDMSSGSDTPSKRYCSTIRIWPGANVCPLCTPRRPLLSSLNCSVKPRRVRSSITLPGFFLSLSAPILRGCASRQPRIEGGQCGGQVVFGENLRRQGADRGVRGRADPALPEQPGLEGVGSRIIGDRALEQLALDRHPDGVGGRVAAAAPPPALGG